MKTGFWLAVTIAGALVAAAAAASGRPPALFAGALALAFGGLAAAAVSAARGLHAPDDLREPRVERGPTVESPLEEGAVSRGVFGRMWLAALGAFGVLGLVPLISLARNPGRREATGWRAGLRLVDENNEPIAFDRLTAGGIATVFPQNGVDIPEASAVLIRIAPDLVNGAAPGDRAAAAGYLAFSKICTHAGCPVGLYRRQAHELYCPCHQSRFDVLDGAKNISGPAPRPLPKLALDVDAQGYLVARADFDAPVGPDDWDRVR